MSLLITNAHVVNAADQFHADVYCDGEQISRIGKPGTLDPKSCPQGTEVIDASGKYVFPGFIDPHVHIHLPFMGTYAKDTWETTSRAALVGGTTSLIEMICPGKTDEPMAAFETWLGKARGVSACDFSFHMGVTRYDPLAESQLREIVNVRGIRSFKVFLAYKGALGVDDRELYHTLKLAKELGVVVTAHCENETLVAERQAELVAAGHTGPEYHEPSRPTIVEASGCGHLMTFAELTGAEVYVVHTSCREAVRAIRHGIGRGVKAHIEVVLPHLVLDESYTRGQGAAQLREGMPHPSDLFEGAKYVMSPPLRERFQLMFMWNHLRSGTISTVATDHAPFDFETQKVMGKPAQFGGSSDFTKIPNGIPSVEDRVNLLFTHGVAAGRIDLNTFVAAASTNAARIFNLKGKGTIAVGADADIVVYDSEYRGTISAKTHHVATDYSAFEGWSIKGRPSVVTSRGRIMARDGQFVGQMGSGKLIPRA